MLNRSSTWMTASRRCAWEVRRHRDADHGHARQLHAGGHRARQCPGPARQPVPPDARRQSGVSRAEGRGAEHLQRLQAHLLPDRLQVPDHPARHLGRVRANAPAACLGFLAAVPGASRSSSSLTAPGGCSMTGRQARPTGSTSSTSKTSQDQAAAPPRSTSGSSSAPTPQP